MSTTAPLTLILFGFTGNLSRKKIIQSWLFLYVRGLLPDEWSLIGVGRRVLSKEEVAVMVQESVGMDWEGLSDERRTEFLERVTYVSGDLRDDAVYLQLTEQLRNHPDHSVAVYVSTFPNLYADVITSLSRHKLLAKKQGTWQRILIEKPLGMDTATSVELNTALHELLPEKDIYRIDHYLAKETVQNIVAFRFANGVFEHMWNSQFIDHIQVTFAESGGVEGREEFYNQTGIVRDILQNHLLQLLSVLLMEEPTSLDAQQIQQKRLNALSDFSILSPREVIERCRFSQYEGAQLEKGVATAAAVRLTVDNPRWSGMPIYVRAGKKMKTNVIEANIVFKEPLNTMFSSEAQSQPGNVLTIRIQPNEGIALRLNLKKPGIAFSLDNVLMSFCYRSGFAALSLVEAYSKVLYDAINGDTSLFLDAKGTDACWRIVEPLLDPHLVATSLDTYPVNTWGPKSFAEVLEAPRTWIEPDLSICAI